MNVAYKILSLFLVLISIQLFAVEKEKGVKIKLKKLTVEKVYFNVGDEKITGKEVPYGTSVEFNAEGLIGFAEKNGMVYINAGIQVLDAKGKEVVRLDNLFSKDSTNDGLNANDIRESIRLYLRCQTPMQMNKSYTLRFTILDKSSKAMISVDKKIVLMPMTGVQHAENGLKSDGVFFYAKAKEGTPASITKNEIQPGEELIWYCTGINGWDEKDGKVFIDASIKWYDGEGELLNEFPDLFKETEIKSIDAKQLLTLYFTPPPETTSGTRFKLVYTVRDKRNNNSMTTSFSFKIR